VGLSFGGGPGLNFFKLEILNLFVFVVAFSLSAFLGVVSIAWSHRLKMLDYPGHRKLHKHPTPVLGGVGIFLSFWLTIGLGFLLVFALDKKWIPSKGLLQIGWLKEIFQGVVFLSPEILKIFFGSLVIVIVGFLDDKFHWSPTRKFFGQCLAVAILLSTNFRIDLVSQWPFFDYWVTFLWVVLIINAFNFIDSVDGHCAGVAFISCMTFFWLVQIIKQPLDGLFLIALAGALLGFLIHNSKPAKIFLGDNGSLFVGYMLAAFTLLNQYHEVKTNFATTLIPVLMFGVPIYDTLSVVVVRLFRGIPPWRGDRNHFAHRLVKIGMSERVAVLFSYFITFIIGFLVILTTQVEFFGAVLLGLIYLSLIAVIAIMEFYITKGVYIKFGRLGRVKK
jgi:UDP-GlcNAc:undecaprenyl-phosphate/decaprenyl-phosphate GlcNAc-1-phosphate transferase